jgi:hypothetical protein
MISSNKKEQSHSNEFEISSLCWPSKNRPWPYIGRHTVTTFNLTTPAPSMSTIHLSATWKITINKESMSKGGMWTNLELHQKLFELLCLKKISILIKYSHSPSQNYESHK